VAKILVADDNSNIQKMVGLALKDQGIDVVAVGNGEAAVRKISDVKPDLVLADVFMPVRNGYEVCKYVKEDSTLAHIPVILLVGAFDPLDEQEAQRVGADGVLKKPFVPPDPLISMVKSALTRAGVSLAPAAPPEKPSSAPARSTADILRGNVGSKTAVLSQERVPEVAPEPLEEFATPREEVKIAAGQEPVAFGSLLQTNEEEEDVAVFSSKPMIEIAKAKNWDEESQDVPEEEEQDEEGSERSGWRPDGLDREPEHAAKATQGAPDWRDEAFHGNSPTKRNGAEPWTPTHEKGGLVQAAETRALTVTTLESRPAGSPIPFSGDAWAAALAAGVGEKIAQQTEKVISTPAPQPVAAVESSVPEALPGTVAATLSGLGNELIPAVEESKAAEPANWAPVPESYWEAEAKRAAMLASTWDAPAPSTTSAEETQEISSYSSEQPEVHAASHVQETPIESSGHYESAPVIVTPPDLPSIDTSAEVTVQAGPSNHWDNAWEAPKAIAPPESFAEQVAAEVEEKATTEVSSAAQPDMDELVARVLRKMSPDVLQRVTHEILKPVIEAIVRDELNSKKS
jgi:CheY-like chemotaxis protein